MDYRNDRQLVADYLSGDRHAFKLIVRRHRQRMYFAARSYARNEQDAQDIVQDALFKAARSLHTYRGDAKLSTWLHRMTINAAIDHQRKDDRARAIRAAREREEQREERRRIRAERKGK